MFGTASRHILCTPNHRAYMYLDDDDSEPYFIFLSYLKGELRIKISLDQSYGKRKMSRMTVHLKTGDYSYACI